MSSKKKGTRYERELFHLFWKNEWAACRSAGSGSTPLPAPDILASNNQRTIAIECKSIKSGSKYLEKEKIEELIKFSTLFGAEPWLGIRFDNKGWFFLKPEELQKNKNDNYSISLDFAMKNGKQFPSLINNQNPA
tara:strand:- start:1294 stop:1698 length:405 start_codon:yes stop_codon:yes gene_type:complete